jgi:hypothetical protein
VQQLSSCVRLQATASSLHESQPEVHVSEQAALLRLSECGPSGQLRGPTHVVQQRGCEQQIGAQARMQLRGLATKRRNADRVLEKPTGV